MRMSEIQFCICASVVHSELKRCLLSVMFKWALYFKVQDSMFFSRKKKLKKKFRESQLRKYTKQSRQTQEDECSECGISPFKCCKSQLFSEIIWPLFRSEHFEKVLICIRDRAELLCTLDSKIHVFSVSSDFDSIVLICYALRNF